MASPSWRITVDAKLLWNSTGATLQKGSAYRMRVLECSDWRDNTIESTPYGGWGGGWKILGWLARFKARFPAAPMYALVGSIGKASDTFFLVDGDTDYVATADGELFLFANDWEGHYDNNNGRLQLEIVLVEP